jgi:MFS family permease
MASVDGPGGRSAAGSRGVWRERLGLADGARTLPLYAGGFLGPFGGAMVAPLIPKIADSLDTTVGYVAASITVYMVPFALLQLVSGTIAERLGGGRVVRLGYVLYGIAAVLCALAPEIWTFLAGRALMGAANAFLSPILLAALYELVPPAVLGRTVGTFAAAQTAGIAFAPVLGGALGEASWRLAFLLVAGVSCTLAVQRLHVSGAREGGKQRPGLRTLLDRWIALLAATATAGYLGFTSIGFVVALVCSREFGLGSATTGLVVAAYGAGGVLVGRAAGRLVDRGNRPKIAFLGGVACALTVLALVFLPNVWSFALVYFGVGLTGAVAWTALNTIVVESFPANRAGAVSAYSAFKFVGVALGPLVYIPLFNAGTRQPFAVAAGLSALFALLVLPWLTRYVGNRPAAGLSEARGARP